MDATQLAVKATIIESEALAALNATTGQAVTDLGRLALHHLADGMISALSVLTAEPVHTIRARLRERAKMEAQADPGRPCRAF